VNANDGGAAAAAAAAGAGAEAGAGAGAASAAVSAVVDVVAFSAAGAGVASASAGAGLGGAMAGAAMDLSGEANSSRRLRAGDSPACTPTAAAPAWVGVEVALRPCTKLCSEPSPILIRAASARRKLPPMLLAAAKELAFALGFTTVPMTDVDRRLRSVISRSV
jgi:hypothetical protein